jgi:hypothetical protein
MTSLSIVGIALAMSQTEVVFTDGVFLIISSTFGTLLSSQGSSAHLRLAVSGFPVGATLLLYRDNSRWSKPAPVPPHPWFSAAYPSALSASGTVHVGRDAYPVRATNLAVFHSADPGSK